MTFFILNAVIPLFGNASDIDEMRLLYDNIRENRILSSLNNIVHFLKYFSNDHILNEIIPLVCFLISHPLMTDPFDVIWKQQ